MASLMPLRADTLLWNEHWKKRKKRSAYPITLWLFWAICVAASSKEKRTWCSLHPLGSFPPVRFHIFSPDYAIVCRGGHCPTPPSHHVATMHGSYQVRPLWENSSGYHFYIQISKTCSHILSVKASETRRGWGCVGAWMDVWTNLHLSITTSFAFH